MSDDQRAVHAHDSLHVVDQEGFDLGEVVQVAPGAAGVVPGVVAALGAQLVELQGQLPHPVEQDQGLLAHLVAGELSVAGCECSGGHGFAPLVI